MPGMMDTVLNLGPERRDRGGPGRGRPAIRASPGTPTAASSRCTARVVLGVDHHRFEEIIEHAKLDAGVHRGHRPDRAGLAPRGRRLQGRWSPRRPASPSRRTRRSSSGARSARCSAVWMNAARQHLSPAARHPRRMGHGGQRPGHGVRQHGRGLRHRRLLHPRPVHRREHLLRRIPGQRAGRGRRRRHPHAAADGQAARPSRAKRRMEAAMPNAYARAGARSARSWSSTTRTCRTSSSRCSRTSCTCCRPATASAPPRPSLQHRGGHGARGADRPRPRRCGG